MTVNPLEAFGALDMRVGRVVRAEPNADAIKPSYRLWIDFGDGPEGLGTKQSSAQITALYEPADLIGREVIAAVNLGSRRVAGFRSDVLVLGVPDEAGRIVLLEPERSARLGGRVS